MNARLILFTSLPPVGAHSTITYNLVRMLRPYYDRVDIWVHALPKKGHFPEMQGALEEMGCGVTLVSDLSGKTNWKAFRAALGSARKQPPTVLLTVGLDGLPVTLAAMLAKAKLAVYHHIIHNMEDPKTVAKLKSIAGRYKKIVFQSPATSDAFPGSAKTPLKFPWVPPSSEIPVASPETLAEEREQYITKPRLPVRFGLLGDLTIEKGGAAILKFLDAGEVACDLHVSGGGPLSATFQDRERRFDPSRNQAVHYYGEYDQSQKEAFLRPFFANIDYLIVPSQDEKDTLPVEALEAFQYGVPVISSRTGGLKSFGLPQLGPAPDNVVRLAEAQFVPGELTYVASLARKPQAETVAACREYYARFFSDMAVLYRWLEVLESERFPTRG